MPIGHRGRLDKRRAEVLSQLVLLFTQGRGPVELADEAVRLVAEATDAAAAFVYLWDAEEERLVLRVASSLPQQFGVNEIKLRLGEGIAGWAALRQQCVIINSRLQDDPRFLGFPTIDENEFNSMLAVPIADEDSELRGVFALYSEGQGVFGNDELAIAVEVGRLLAAGLLRAETVENLSRQSASSRFLLDFSAASRTSMQSALEVAARRLLDLLQADACVIEYMSRRDSGGTPIMIASRSGDDEADHRTWSTYSRSAAQTRIDQQCTGLEHASVALGMGSSRGILSCYRRPLFRASDFDRLNSLAMQLSVLLEAIDLNSVGSSLATALRFTEDDIEAGRILGDLDLDGPVCPVLVRVRSVRGDWEAASRHLKESLTAALGSRSVVLLDSTWGLVLVDAPGGRIPVDLSSRILHAVANAAPSAGLVASIGIGSVASEPSLIRQAIADARQALEWTETYDRGVSVTLAAYGDIREAWPLTDVVAALKPQLLEHLKELELLARYDVELGSHLVRTLSVLAGCGGSVNETAHRLLIHRNTLRQRLHRIERVLGRPIQPTSDWTVLSLATRVIGVRVDRLRVNHRQGAPPKAPN